MRSSLVIFFFLFISHYLFGQNLPDQDSLFQIWNTTSNADATRLNALDDMISYHFGAKNQDSTIFYAKQMYKKALEVSDRHFQARAFHLMGMASSEKALFDTAVTYLNNAYEIWDEIEFQKGISFLFFPVNL